MKRLVTLLVLQIIAHMAQAQYRASGRPHDYSMPPAVGLRLSPDGLGITGKLFFGTSWALDLQVNGSQGFRVPEVNSAQGGERPARREGDPGGRSWTAGGLMEYNYIFNNVSWRIYGGAGAHFGKWDRYDHLNDPKADLPEGIFGFDAVLGGEYLFKRIPLGISAEVKPAVNVFNDAVFFPNNMLGASVRYYFGHLVTAY